MDKRGLFEDKKAEESILISTVIFLVLNALFISMLIGFVYLNSSGAKFYEEMHAKQIALFINSVPEGRARININFERALEIARENQIPEWHIVEIKDGHVKVKLGTDGYYRYPYFSDFNVVPTFSGDFLVLDIFSEENIGEENV